MKESEQTHRHTIQSAKNTSWELVTLGKWSQTREMLAAKKKSITEVEAGEVVLGYYIN